MSRRKTRPHPRASTPGVTTATAPAAIAPSLPTGGSSSVSFAQQSTAHNYTPPLPRREQERLTGQDLRTVHSKADRFFSDCPYASGPITSIADYLGPIKPRAATLDDDWNLLANNFVDSQYWDLGLWDASGKFTSAHAQRQLNIYGDLHGDVLAVLTNHEDGTPCVRMVPATAIDSPASAYGSLNSDWQDGVRVGLHHRHLAWHVLRNESAPIRLSSFDRAGFVVEAKNAVMIGNFTVGGVRGISRLIGVGSTITQMQMYDNATHDLFALASKIGMSLESAADGPAPSFKPVEGAFKAFTAPTEATTPEGNLIEITRFREQFLGDGPAVITPPAGATVNLHNLDRDLPDIAALRGSDLERIAMHYGLPVQILFCIISGAFNVTGPNVRLVLGRAKTWRDQELAKREPLIRRQYARIMEWAIRTGQLPMPKKDNRYWLAKMQWAKNYSIDALHDVNIDQKLLAMGLTTQAELAEEYGTNAFQNIKDQVAWVKEMYQSLLKDDLPTTIHFPGWLPPHAPSPAA